MKRPSLSTTPRPIVLLVQASRDDSLEMYAEFLRYHGLVVIPVSDARDALMLASQADIVVTGMILDDPIDGVELVSRLRHDDGTRFTPVIVLTACPWPKDRARAEGAGCDVFLRPAPDASSSTAAGPDRSANVIEYDIARRAYDLYLARGCEDGHDVDDWLQADEICRRRGSMNRGELEGRTCLGVVPKF